jgi:hypothetical protein
VIGEQGYAMGVGMHAPCALTYTIPPGAASFVAEIGLDGVLGRHGDCVFVVEIDGEERLRTHLTGGDPAATVVLPVAGSRTLVLRAEAGANFDIGDYANWCSARFVLTP